MCLEREVAGVEQVKLGVRKIPPERLGARHSEEWIVAAPHHERRRAVRAKELLERGFGFL